MASAKKRLEQVNGHVQDGGAAPAENIPPIGIICVKEELLPGHIVATITFSNPSKLNVASKQLLDSLIRTCEDLGKDDKLRVVILTGAPPTGKTPAFIGGADVHELNQISSSDEARAYIHRVHSACAAIRDLPVPVIARVNGFALGAGLELMACCDLKVATSNSNFGMPEVKIGLPSVVEAAIFPGLIGFGRTKRLVYLGENISAKEAEAWGLVEKVVENEAELNRAVDEWSRAIIGMAPENMRNQKRLVRTWENATTLQEAIQAGVETLADAYADGGEEAKKFMKPFLGRNK